MTIQQTLVDSFLLECLQAIHDLSADSIKLALYNASAGLSHSTTAYSATNEVTGSGYSAGGLALTNFSGYPQLSSTGKALMDFADLSVNPLAVTAYQGLIYNSSKSNKAIAVLDFLPALICTTSWSLVWQAPTDSTATIRLGASR